MHPHPRTLVEVVRLAQEGHHLSVVLDEFLDAFYEAPHALRQAMIEDEPPRIGMPRDDAMIGAVGEHLARRWGLSIPDWAADDSRDAPEPWFVGSIPGLAPLFLVESPIAFRRRRIFTEAEPLRRARMPFQPVEYSG